MSTARASSDLRRVLAYWRGLPKHIRLLDAASLLNMALFVVGAVLIQTQAIMSFRNSLILVYVMGTAGISGYMRSRMAADMSEEDRAASVKLWFVLAGSLAGITMGLLLFYPL